MDAPSLLPYRTELRAYISDLIGFIEDKISEAEADPGSRAAALSEAAGAFPMIRDRLLREDQTIHAQFMLIGFFDLDLERLASLPPDEFAAATHDLRRCLSGTRSVLQET